MKSTMLISAGVAVRSCTSIHFARWSYSSESQPKRNVAILGAVCGIGQPLALLIIKPNPLVSPFGVAADVSYFNSRA